MVPSKNVRGVDNRLRRSVDLCGGGICNELTPSDAIGRD